MKNEDLLQTAVRVNTRIAILIENARGALRGEHDFNADDVRALLEPLQEMAPIVGKPAESPGSDPQMASQLKIYKSQLDELQTTLQKIRVMLLAKKAELQAKQTHSHAVGQWTAAFRKTS